MPCHLPSMNCPLQVLDTVVVDAFQHRIETGRVVATVVHDRIMIGPGDAHGVGHLFRLNQVLVSHLNGVQPQVLAHYVHHTLTVEAGLVAARSTISAHARLVCQQAQGAPLEVGNVVGSHHDGGDARGHQSAVGAHVGPNVARYSGPERGDGAVALGGDFQFTGVLPGLISRYQVLPAVLNPLDGTTELLGGKGYQEVLGVEFARDAEAAAHIALDEVDTVLCHLQQVGPKRHG